MKTKCWPTAPECFQISQQRVPAEPLDFQAPSPGAGGSVPVAPALLAASLRSAARPQHGPSADLPPRKAEPVTPSSALGRLPAQISPVIRRGRGLLVWRVTLLWQQPLAWSPVAFRLTATQPRSLTCPDNGTSRPPSAVSPRRSSQDASGAPGSLRSVSPEEAAPLRAAGPIPASSSQAESRCQPARQLKRSGTAAARVSRLPLSSWLARSGPEPEQPERSGRAQPSSVKELLPRGWLRPPGRPAEAVCCPFSPPGGGLRSALFPGSNSGWGWRGERSRDVRATAPPQPARCPAPPGACFPKARRAAAANTRRARRALEKRLLPPRFSTVDIVQPSGLLQPQLLSHHRLRIAAEISAELTCGGRRGRGEEGGGKRPAALLLGRRGRVSSRWTLWPKGAGARMLSWK